MQVYLHYAPFCEEGHLLKTQLSACTCRSILQNMRGCNCSDASLLSFQLNLHIFSRVLETSRTSTASLAHLPFPSSQLVGTQSSFLFPLPLACPTNSHTKFTTSPHRTRSDACITAHIAVDFCTESTCRSKNATHCKGGFCDAHPTAQFACLVPSKALNREIHIVGCKSASHHRIASRDLANLDTQEIQKKNVRGITEDIPKTRLRTWIIRWWKS